MIKFFYKLSKVFTVANMAGAGFSVCCIDGPHWIRALILFSVLFVLTCFFMVLHEILEEMV